MKLSLAGLGMASPLISRKDFIKEKKWQTLGRVTSIPA
jgi:hypothetical protein